MYKTILSLFLFGACLFSSQRALADEVPALTVEYVAVGTQAYVKALSTIGHLAFANGKATIEFANGVQEELGSLEDLQHMAFGKVDEAQLTPSAALKGASAFSVSVYPNPACDHVHVDGVERGQTIRLFNENGAFVLSSQSADIDLSSLPAGLYILQVGSNVAKIIKK